jgi:hypothetical protein
MFFVITCQEIGTYVSLTASTAGATQKSDFLSVLSVPKSGLRGCGFFITASHTEEQIRHSIDVTAEEVERINPKYLGQARPVYG